VPAPSSSLVSVPRTPTAPPRAVASSPASVPRPSSPRSVTVDAGSATSPPTTSPPSPSAAKSRPLALTTRRLVNVRPEVPLPLLLVPPPPLLRLLAQARLPVRSSSLASVPTTASAPRPAAPSASVLLVSLRPDPAVRDVASVAVLLLPLLLPLRPPPRLHLLHLLLPLPSRPARTPRRSCSPSAPATASASRDAAASRPASVPARLSLRPTALVDAVAVVLRRTATSRLLSASRSVLPAVALTKRLLASTRPLRSALA
jgi:hypothetical protein